MVRDPSGQISIFFSLSLLVVFVYYYFFSFYRLASLFKLLFSLLVLSANVFIFPQTLPFPLYLSVFSLIPN